MDTDNIQPEDLVSDDTFIAWFRQSDPAHIQYWNNWIAAHPASTASVEEAVRLLRLLEMEEVPTAAGHTRMAAGRLMAAVNAAGNPAIKVIPLYRRKVFRWTAAAAAIAVIFISVLLFRPRSTSQYATRFGETKNITLPDGSLVTLNANSRLHFKGKWDRGASREVWLEGEGFFSVNHTVNPSRFIVHSGRLDVEVLGTEFNVKQRRQQTTVVLKSGKVRLILEQEPAAPVMMAPGDLVAYNNNTGQVARKQVNASAYASWKEGKMVFENAGIGEIAEVLKENYGVQLNIGDSSLKGKEFNGIFPTDNLHILLKALSKAYNLEIVTAGREISIHSRDSASKQ